MIKRLAWSGCFLLFLTFSAGWAESSQGWNINAFRDRQGRECLRVENPSIAVEFGPHTHAWMLRQFSFGDKVVVGYYGSNSSVLRVSRDAPWERPQEAWLGAGHGGEKIKSLIVDVDGNRLEYNRGFSLSGKSVSFIKESGMGPFFFKSVVRFPETGDYFEQIHTYHVTESLEKLNFIYAFMHCVKQGFDEWIVFLPDGRKEKGEAGRSDGSFSLNRDISAISFYNREEEKGVVFTYPEPYKGEQRKNFIWDRANDNKLYLRPNINQNDLKIGDELEYKVRVAPFEASPENWENRAEQLVQW